MVEELSAGAREEMKVVEDRGGAVKAVPYMKARLVESHRERVGRIERGEQKVIGQNSFTETAESPLTAGADGGIMTPDPEVERELIVALERWKDGRDDAAVSRRPRGARRRSPPTTRGTSCRRRSPPPRPGRRPESGRRCCAKLSAPTAARPASTAPPPRPIASSWRRSAARVEETEARIGHRIKILVGKPGLDGHSNGAEQIALRAKDVGMEVIYQGIRLTPAEIATSALQEDVDVVGLSILSGSHLELIPEVVRLLSEEGLDTPVVVGGIIPVAHAERLREAGVAGVYTPKDFDVNRIMAEIVALVDQRAEPGAAA